MCVEKKEQREFEFLSGESVCMSEKSVASLVNGIQFLFLTSSRKSGREEKERKE